MWHIYQKESAQWSHRLLNADFGHANETTTQKETGWMPRLIGVVAGRMLSLLVLPWRGLYLLVFSNHVRIQGSVQLQTRVGHTKFYHFKTHTIEKQGGPDPLRDSGSARVNILSRDITFLSLVYIFILK